MLRGKGELEVESSKYCNGGEEIEGGKVCYGMRAAPSMNNFAISPASGCRFKFRAEQGGNHDRKCKYRVSHHVSDLGWVDFDLLVHCPPDSAWADENRQNRPDNWNIQIKVNPTQVRNV